MKLGFNTSYSDFGSPEILLLRKVSFATVFLPKTDRSIFGDIIFHFFAVGMTQFT